MDWGNLSRDFSLEITRKDLGDLVDNATLLPAGSAISITYLPGDRIEDLAQVAASVRRLGLEPVPHISARRIRSDEELARFLRTLSGEAGIRRAFLIAGDLAEPLGPYADALSLVESGLLEAHGITRIGVAGYPEGHPAIPEDVLRAALADKIAAAASRGLDLEIVTQFLFDADRIADWVCTLRAQGIRHRVRVGVAGPASVQALLRYAARCGVGASAKVMAKYGVSLTRLLAQATPDRLLTRLGERLADAGEQNVKLHLYPFGGLSKTVRWMHAYAAAAPAIA
ncbi:methylenetetrahydrofolate reductase [Sphingomonas sp. CGMCC 1.13654]|uniref:Methylenetetrahydrofolate reductase n=1 Tax=Sphingomonas chungangi TaxID=2683589 RepID=A0A838L7F5_9SPHN|nr:methylenetetrahydrofolate reductase [Sphingomonas chungangi]MBA2933488.1 methylenetetrahydrofolate reductase [Sphingomonas chungangi]MVW54821.1 methylenetetrahydrofolate reductase [Sphingomonas chungangi]